MAQDKPVILLAHGAWHSPIHYREFLDALEAAGYETVAPELVSSSDNPPPKPTEADIELIAGKARELADQGREVVAVAHSYGGVVVTEALSGLGVRERKAKGLPGGVKRIVYVAAFILEKGKSLEDNGPVEVVKWPRYEGEFKTFNPGYDIGAIFYPDLPQEEQQKWLKTLKKHPKATSFYTPTNFAFTEIDTAFVYLEKDVAFPLFAQKTMVESIKEQGVNVQEETLPSGHFPSLSMPRELAQMVIKLA
ncbi:Alpha/beta hydrolase fold-1 [Trichoderma barbatum]